MGNFTLKEKGTRSTLVKTQKTEVMKRKAIGLKFLDEERFLRHLKAEMQKMGATEADYALIHRSIIRNALQNKRTPRDVAWAIMQ